LNDRYTVDFKNHKNNFGMGNSPPIIPVSLSDWLGRSFTGYYLNQWDQSTSLVLE